LVCWSVGLPEILTSIVQDVAQAIHALDETVVNRNSPDITPHWRN